MTRTRTTATIPTGIWREAYWRELPGSAQRTRLMLGAQPDISAAGVLGLAIARWADFAADTTVASLRSDLVELIVAQIIDVDEATDELLVVSYVDDDRGYTNSKRCTAILAAAAQIRSPRLRARLAVEFARLGLPTDFAPDDLPDALADVPSDRATDSHARVATAAA